MATILHIEDDPQSRLLVRKLLCAAGHSVVETASGVEGARLADTARPDLVLLDINVPDLNGYEVALLLRGRLPDVPLVAITAEGDRATALAVGCNGFIEKPIDVRSFSRTVEGFLGVSPSAAPAPSVEPLLAQGQRIAARLEAKVYELSDANDRLREADRLRKEFYRNVSHELATPLTPLVGWLGLLGREELGPLGPAQKKAVTAMDDAVRRLRGAIDALLDVTQMEAGRARYSFAPYDFGALVRRCLDARRGAFEARRQRLVTDLPQTPLPCHGDADRLARAVGHLVDNASKFSPDDADVAVEVRSGATHCELFVCDAGPGVAVEWLGRIFDPFVQVDGSPTRGHGGAGVGLAIVRGVAEAHGGGVIAEPGGRSPVAGLRLGGLLVRMRVAREPSPPVTA